MLMVVGDLNARPGNNNSGRERVIGKHGIGNVNDMAKDCVISVKKTTWL